MRGLDRKISVVCTNMVAMRRERSGEIEDNTDRT